MYESFNKNIAFRELTKLVKKVDLSNRWWVSCTPSKDDFEEYFISYHDSSGAKVYLTSMGKRSCADAYVSYAEKFIESWIQHSNKGDDFASFKPSSVNVNQTYDVNTLLSSTEEAKDLLNVLEDFLSGSSGKSIPFSQVPDEVEDNSLRMNDIDIMLSLLREVFVRYPDLRLGQLIINLTGGQDSTTYYMKDEVLKQKIVDFLNKHP